MSIPYSVIDYPFVGALREDVEPKVLSDGFTQVYNGRYLSTGKIAKRLGLTQVTEQGLGHVDKLVVDGNRLVGLGTSTTVMSAYANEDQWLPLDRVSNATIRREPISRNMAEDVLEANIGYSNGWIFYVWVVDSTAGHAAHISCVNATTGAVSQLSFSGGVMATGVDAVRAVAGPSGVLLVTYKSGANLVARSFDTTANPPTQIATANLTSAINFEAYDVISDGADGWWVAFADTASDIKAVRVVDSGLTISTTITIAGTCFWPCIALSWSALDICYWDNANNELRYDHWSTAGAHLAGPFTLDTTEPANQPAAIQYSSNTVTLFAWTIDATDGPIRKWRTGTSSGSLGTVHTNFRCLQTSKIFSNAIFGGTRFYQWIKSQDSNAVLNRQTQALVQLGESSEDLLRPIALAAFGSITDSLNSEMQNVAVESANQYRSACLLAVLPGAQRTGFDETITRFDHPSRFTAETFGPATYVGGGHLQQIATTTLEEHAFFQVPYLTAADVAGAVLPAGDYQYCLVYEYLDDKGLVTRSVPSEIQTVTVTDHGGGLGGVDMEIAPLTLTRRQRNSLGVGHSSKVLLAVYRTEIGPPNPPIFYREYTVDAHPSGLENDPTDLANVTWTEAVSDATIITHEQLYTTGGVLENDGVYGGCTSLARHKNRLFATGGELKDIIWYSQEFVNSSPPLFNIATQIQIAGEDIVAVGSLDDALIAFTTDKIFAIYGEGPNALGDPSSGYYANPQLITSDAGCDYARSLVQTSRGIYFSYRGALYLLNRGRQVQLVSTPIQETAAFYSVVNGAAYVPDLSEVRFVCTDSSGVSGATLVYNEQFDRWTVSFHFGGQPVQDCVLYDNHFHVAFDANLWRESDDFLPSYLDDGDGYALTVQTGDMSFGTWQSLKRVRRVRVMYTAEDTPSGGMKLRIVSHDTSQHSETHAWTATQLLANTSESVRAHVKYQKGHRYQFQLTEDPVPTGQGLSFIGLSFEVGMMTGLQRNAAAESA